MLKSLVDIFSILKGAVDNGTVEDFALGNKKIAFTMSPKKSSISRLAANAMAYFTCLVDDQCTLDEGMLISRGLEKRFASFLLIAMSMDPAFDLSEERTLADYVQKFHQNMDDGAMSPKFSLETATVESLEKLAESVGIEYKMFATTETARIMHAIYQGVHVDSINNEAAKVNFYVEESLNTVAVNDYGTAKAVHEAVAGKEGALIGTEFKKANDMVPTLLHIVITDPTKKSKDLTGQTSFVIGVKATLHPVSQSTIILNLVKGLKNDDTFFRFMRWTTGEIKFMKDFLFMVDQLKLEAVTSTNNSGHKYFNMGRRRRELANIKNRFTKENLMPNMTLIVTTDCLQKIKDEYGYDITPKGGASQVALIKKLMYNYFMLGFVIVDQGLTRVHIMIDGDADFETYTYAGLEKEGQVNDRQFKEMMKMLGRGGA